MLSVEWLSTTIISDWYNPVEAGKELRHNSNDCEQLKVTMQIEISTEVGSISCKDISSDSSK